MRLLLDAHTFLWFVWDDVQLGTNARTLIVDPSNQKLISAATYWEIAIKVSIGKLDLGEPYRGFMHREINRNNFDTSARMRRSCGCRVVLAIPSSRPVRPPADRPGYSRADAHCQQRYCLRCLPNHSSVVGRDAARYCSPRSYSLIDISCCEPAATVSRADEPVCRYNPPEIATWGRS